MKLSAPNKLSVVITFSAAIALLVTGCVHYSAVSTGTAGSKHVSQMQEAQESAANSLSVPVRFTNSVGMKLILIPPGEYMMGCSGPDADINEKPLHKVRITKPFYLGAYEVTQAQYTQLTNANPSMFKGDNLPVEMVSAGEALGFCAKLSEQEGRTYRLPTEAEWEYACRAGTTTPFSFGDTISTDQANYCGYGVYGKGRPGVFRDRTTPVGSFRPNAFGLYDMHGNVWEWCSDYYSETYYAESPVDNPQGPKAGPLGCVVRGGGWFYGPWHSRSSSRDRYSSADRFNYHFGFRVVCEIQAVP